jgi:pyruvate dehydrogenase E2 component (dihydrolipoamide acetyltransferase)
MAEKVQMLALSPTMESGTIVNWTKKEGDPVVNGDILCEVETDKATMEYEAIQEGTLLRILLEGGSSAVVGQTIAIIGEAGDDIAGIVKEAEEESNPQGKRTTEDAQSGLPNGSPTGDVPASPLAELTPDSGEADGRVKASPLARKMATQIGVPIAGIKGSGPGGRIVKRDVERAFESVSASVSTTASSVSVPGTVVPGAVAPGVAPALVDEVIPISGKRKIIAQRLGESKYSAPHFYLKMSAFTESMMAARKALNAKRSQKVSVNAFLMKFAAEAIKRHPVINSSWQGDTIRQFGSIDVGLAVAQEDGLVTPIVRNCGGKGIVQIDHELSELIERAKQNKLTPEDYTGATFTISSLGTFGVDEFTAIINPPGSAILAVGQMQKVPVVDDNDEIVVRMQMKLTLSCDHRVIDGAKGARFLEELKGTIENPIRALY